MIIINLKSIRTLFISLLILFFSYSLFSQNKNISGGYVFEGEPFLAVDPANPQHMVVQWMGYVSGHALNLSIKTKVTFNGGKTWSNTVNLPHFSSTWKSADPSMVFDKNGDIIACYIDYREAPDSGGVFIIKSHDGGLSWTDASKVIDGLEDGTKRPIDRPWLAIDNSNGPYSGNLYITSKPAPWIPAPNRPYFMKSTDAGLTWSHFRYVDTTKFLVGNFIQAPMAMLTVTNIGNLHIIYPSWETSQNFLPGFLLASSSDGGNSFKYNPVIYSNKGSSDTLAKMGYHIFTDPSNPKHLAFIYLSNSTNDLDVTFIESYDNGIKWTAPLRVNDDAKANGKMQDLIWGNFNNNGDIVIAWRDRRNASAFGYENPSEIYASVRFKDSTKFSKNFRISDTIAGYNTVLSQSGNDFLNVCLFGDTLAAVWGDVRNGRLNIWFDKQNIKTNISIGSKNIVNEVCPLINVFPNPSSDIIRIEGQNIKEIIVFDISGREILRQKNQLLNISKLKPGEYSAQIKTPSGILEKKFIKQ